MPPLVCPRCQSPNPDFAVFCHHDGTNLRAGHAGQDFNRLASEFVFPSGRKARTFDELALGFQEDWPAARDLLRKGQLQQYFGSIGRMDMARFTQEAMAKPDPDVGLTELLSHLPASKPLAPRLDLAPRRLQFLNVVAGEQRQAQLTISNQGQGMLAGTLSVAEGNQWLRLPSGNGNLALKTPKEQQILLQVDTRGLAAAQTYGGKLTLLTNGGTFEVPVRLDLAAHPFPKGPFQGARKPRELAEKMRAAPKAAGPLLETGEVARWFAQNGWNYPVAGTPAKGVAGVQQFFEALGLAKPPPVQLSQSEVRCTVTPGETIQAQVKVFTTARKWVYASAQSDQPWLKVLTPTAAGPQQANVAYEIDGRLVPRGRASEGTLTIDANGGQVLSVRVKVQAEAAHGIFSRVLLRPILTGALLFLLMRFAGAPIIDGYARWAATSAAGQKVAMAALPADSPARPYGGWMRLPWFHIMMGKTTPILDEALGVHGPASETLAREFRDAFSSSFIRIFTLLTFWIGSVAGMVLMLRRGGPLQVPWGVIAGTMAGLAVAATLASLVLIVDLGPHFIWEVVLRSPSAVYLLPVWVILALVSWTLIGAALGLALGLLGPLGRPVLLPMQAFLAGVFGRIGMQSAAAFFED